MGSRLAGLAGSGSALGTVGDAVVLVSCGGATVAEGAGGDGSLAGATGVCPSHASQDRESREVTSQDRGTKRMARKIVAGGEKRNWFVAFQLPSMTFACSVLAKTA